jgi:hypothetical protein
MRTIASEGAIARRTRRGGWAKSWRFAGAHVWTARQLVTFARALFAIHAAQCGKVEVLPAPEGRRRIVYFAQGFGLRPKKTINSK